MKKEDMKAYGIYAVFFAILLVIAFSGCAKMTNWAKNNELNLQTSVHIATALVIKGHPERAERITVIVSKVQAQIAVGALTNASQVKNYVLTLLDLEGLTDADKIIMADLMEHVQSNILQTFKDENLTAPSDQLVEIVNVCGWILDISKTVK